MTETSTLNRRRFLAISASAALASGWAQAGTLKQWTGNGLGARMTITLDHPEGESIARRTLAEVDRLEDIFSLYRAKSALSRLNADGRLDNPPFELLECFSVCQTAHRVSNGVFDPTVQPLWQLYAEAFSSGRRPTEGEIRRTLDVVGWNAVDFAPSRVQLRPGMALTLNGIAQGYVADRVARMLEYEGLTDILINTGEFAALGGDWPVFVDARRVSLRNRALASSSPLGTVFDSQGLTGHILDPVSGLPAAPTWRIVSVTAASAALADALSTAGVLMTKHEMDKMLSQCPAKLVHAST